MGALSGRETGGRTNHGTKDRGVDKCLLMVLKVDSGAESARYPGSKQQCPTPVGWQTAGRER